jgi:cytochrome P450
MSELSTVVASSGPVATPNFPMPRDLGCPLDPPPALTRIRQECPITKVRMWDGKIAWLLTNYDDIRTLLSNPNMSSDGTAPGFPYRGEVDKVRKQEDPQNIVTSDDPQHARLRRAVSHAFTIKRMEGLRPVIQTIVDDLLDKLLSGPKSVDLVKEFALPVPTQMICHMLGVSYQDREFFQTRTALTMTHGVRPDQVVTAVSEMREYIDELICQKTKNPADDMLTVFAKAVQNGEMTRREAAVFGSTLLVGGHETSANMIGLGVLTLLQHPDQLTRLRETDDPKLVASAIEEILRWLNVAHGGRMRVAKADVEIREFTIKAGDAVILTTETANRDPQYFPNPDTLDIGRDARHHLAFGFGVHQCLGQPLARIELQVVYKTIADRIPTLKLATDIVKLPFKLDGFVFGVHSLPVTW